MTPRLSVKHLQVLASFNRHRNLTKIAEFLKLTPSAVSRRIDEAEARLGFALFMKSSNRVRLTPAGEHILLSAEQILADLERAESVASQLDENVRHVVRIGMSVYANFSWFPDFSSEFLADSPHIRLELIVDCSGNELDYLKSGAADIILAPSVGQHPGISTTQLFNDELVALVAPTHKLSGRTFILPGDIEETDFYTYSMAVTPGFEYLEFLKPANIHPKRYILLETPEAAAAALKGGAGLSVLSRWAMHNEIQDQRLVAISLTAQGIFINWSAMLLQTKQHLPPITAVLSCWKKYILKTMSM